MSEPLFSPMLNSVAAAASATSATSMTVLDVSFQNLETLDSGLLERSRNSPRTIEVPLNTLALEVASYVDGTNIDTVLVQDNQGQIRGALFPEWARSQISQHLGITFNSLTEALAELAQRPEEAMRSYRHEYLTFERPHLVWCESGSHFTYTLPCPDHS